jgi:hypothetical protein
MATTTYEFTCEWCQENVVLTGRAAYEARRRKGRFCSSPCANNWIIDEAKKARREKYKRFNEKVEAVIPGTKLIPLDKAKLAIVDEGDYEQLSQHTWYAFPGRDDKFYAASRTGSCYRHTPFALMHRLIAVRVLGRKLRRDEVVHHIDENPLNNRKSNLLLCSISYHNWLHRKIQDRKQQIREETREAA